MAEIGDPMHDHRPVCGHADTFDSPRCERPALWHLLINDADQYGMTSLSACRTHLPVARSCGDVLQEHRYDGVCGLPGTLWDPRNNLCVLDGTGVSRYDVGVNHG